MAFFNRSRRSPAHTRRDRPLAVEALESRLVPDASLSSWIDPGAVLHAAQAVVSQAQTNLSAPGAQVATPLARDAHGESVVVWSGNGPDAPGPNIYAERYDASGNPLGAVVRVNSTTVGGEARPAVAMDANGDYVISWMSNAPTGQHFSIYAQRFNTAGAAQGGEFRANTTTATDQVNPNVAMDATGNFNITWGSDHQDGQGWGTYDQQFNALGQTVGQETRLGAATAIAMGTQIYAQVQMNGNQPLIVFGAGSVGASAFAAEYYSYVGAMGTQASGPSMPGQIMPAASDTYFANPLGLV